MWFESINFSSWTPLRALCFIDINQVASPVFHGFVEVYLIETCCDGRHSCRWQNFVQWWRWRSLWRRASSLSVCLWHHLSQLMIVLSLTTKLLRRFVFHKWRWDLCNACMRVHVRLHLCSCKDKFVQERGVARLWEAARTYIVLVGR